MKKLLTLAFMLFATLAFAQTKNMQSFGDKISADGAQKAPAVLAELIGQEKAQLKVKGQILKVCKKKGCWMTMDLGNKEKMLIRFKDYGFFVPLDCDGKTAIIQGTAKKEVISVAQLRHYAKDAGKSKKEIEAITKPQKKYTFEAVGVLIEAEK
ncbi:MAG TPA: DUF4920 domain-containing protein [Microscillaceae bacterium]|nr:DUF4920 domain-containing protein [Microscillaceae bacterium]